MSNMSLPIGSRSILAKIDMIFAVVCYALLISASLVAYGDYVARSCISEALSLSTGIRNEYIMQFIHTGAWSTPKRFVGDGGDSYRGKYITGVDFQDKSYTFNLRLPDDKTYKISFRVAEGSRINWLCGYQAPLPGHVPSATNETNLPVEYLPIACRDPNHD